MLRYKELMTKEKTPEQLFNEVLMDKNGLSLMDLLEHPDLRKFLNKLDKMIVEDEEIK